MRSLESALKILRTSQYLAACRASPEAGITHVELLCNGEKFAGLVKDCWKRVFPGPNSHTDNVADDCTRTGFASDADFVTKIEHLREQSSESPFLKTIGIAPAANMASIQFAHSSKNVTHLICDFPLYTPEAIGRFYSWQRERKIWWMRLSANPGRYFVEPYDLEANEKNTPAGSKSITIKSKFVFGALEMEHITVVPEIKINRAVIRSRIQLEPAVCALLLDGTDHGQLEPLLLLSGSLAPCQCAVVCFHTGEQPTDDLRDLCLHINAILRRAGIRTAAMSAAFARNLQKFRRIVQTLDSSGTPYCLIVEEQTLVDGLLELRSRDTTLQESIHISDLPAYLLEIFNL